MSFNTAPATLVLASTSRYRRQLLERLGLPFDVAAPHVDEAVLAGESPTNMVQRLSQDKARAVAGEYPAHLIIGSDQVACLDERVMGKPGTRQAAVAQLSAASGRAVTFYTGLTLLDSRADCCRSTVIPYRIQFRRLTRQEIERYVDAEQPFDCAGSIKSEGLGITLFATMDGNDPTALMGLPLIALCELLRDAGVSLP